MIPDDWYDAPVPDDDDATPRPDPHDPAWVRPVRRPRARLDRPDADLWDDDDNDSLGG